MAKNKEAFSQIGYLRVTESAANTLTFNGLSVFSNVLGQKGMIVHNAEYAPTLSSMALVVTTGDILTFGIAGTDTPTAPDYANAEFYDINQLASHISGTPASFNMLQEPFVRDFTGLPGGGLLVPADRLYAFAEGTSLGSATTVDVRFHYTIIDLAAAEYLELAQAMRVLR